MFATSGAMWVRSDHAIWLTPPTRAIWLPAGVRHSIVVRGEVSLRTLYIARDRAIGLPGVPTVVEVVPLLRELILRIVKVGMLARDTPTHARMASFLLDLLLEAEPQDLILPLPCDARALRLADRIRSDPADPTGLGQLAVASGASLRTLQRTFTAETGLTLELWRQKARLLHAVIGLSNRESVTNVSMDCGYRSVGAFIAAFQRHFGITPGRYSASSA
ncbi:helix-turn-helix transcriptional regulator (plasmid) [Sphingomonas sp. NY01]|uniref:AraC family transcriptional regulator n=1 Tax=Sphingomonas sp. NY01 TaxID=2968057 RepID=UPI00315D2D87